MLVVELRQYTVHAGRRDAFLDLFEREFLELHEAVGMPVIGLFRDLDDPNRVVWLRGFLDMVARPTALSAFYGSEIWKGHRAAANATMLDSDNVLLLAPTAPEAGFDGGVLSGFVVANICYVEAGVLPEFVEFFEASVLPVIAQAGARVLGCYQSEFGINTFAVLPVRDDSVFVWFAGFDDAAAFERYQTDLRRAPDPRAGASSELLRQFARKPEVLRLASALRANTAPPR